MNDPGAAPRERPVVDALRLAVGTLSALPVRPPARIDGTRAGLAMTIAPLAAIVPGLAAAAVAAGTLAVGLSAAVAAVSAVGASVVASRGLHLDGLADTADGLAASYDRERALAVMRSGDTGPAGVVAVVLVLLGQVTALAQALTGFGPSAALVAVLAGRAVLPLACARGIPAARPEGLGATVAGSVPRLRAAVSLLVTMVITAGLAALAARTAAAVGVPGAGPATTTIGAGAAALAGAGAVLAAAAAAGLVTARARSRFGGITGDVLGADVELGTAAALLVLAAAVR